MGCPISGGSASRPTFRNDEVEAQRRRWTFYETINF
jgi:hypothetical protein